MRQASGCASHFRRRWQITTEGPATLTIPNSNLRYTRPGAIDGTIREGDSQTGRRTVLLNAPAREIVERRLQQTGGPRGLSRRWGFVPTGRPWPSPVVPGAPRTRHRERPPAQPASHIRWSIVRIRWSGPQGRTVSDGGCDRRAGSLFLPGSWDSHNQEPEASALGCSCGVGRQVILCPARTSPAPKPPFHPTRPIVYNHARPDLTHRDVAGRFPPELLIIGAVCAFRAGSTGHRIESFIEQVTHCSLSGIRTLSRTPVAT